MYIGPFYFDTKEIVLVLLAITVGAVLYFSFPILWFNPRTLLLLVILMLFTKGLLPAVHNEAFFILALSTVVLSLFVPLFQLLLFYFISFVFFRILRVI